MEFLHNAQLPNGEFKTYACTDDTMFMCQFDSSIFISTFVVYSIRDIQNEHVPSITKSATDFIQSKQLEGGIWKYYWTGPNAQTIDPDLDDTAVASYALRSNNIEFPDNSEVFKRNTDTGGRFLTWLRSSSATPNYLDCGVNANVLLDLGNNQASCTYVNESIKNDNQCSSYYSDSLSIYYLASRAAIESAPCLNDESSTTVSRVLSRVQRDGSFGSALQTALALNTLLNYGYNGPEVEEAAQHLVGAQRGDGSWERGPFYIAGAFYFGSEELTTAVALEALNKYSLRNK